MTSVLIPSCERMHSDTKTKTNNFALVERYHNLLNSLNEGGDCSDVMMEAPDQEVPTSAFCVDRIKTEVEDDPETVPDTPTILCDLSNYLPADSILHPAYDNVNNTNKITTPAISLNSSTVKNNCNISTPAYRNNGVPAQNPVSEPSRQPPSYFTFQPYSTATTTPFSSYSDPTSIHKHQHQYSTSSLSSSPMSSSLSTSLSSSQSQFWSTSSTNSPSLSSSSSPSLHRQMVSKNNLSPSLLSSPLSSASSLSSSSSSMFSNSVSPAPSPFSSSPSSMSSSSSPSPLLSSTLLKEGALTDAKPRTFISELSGSGCTVLSGVPNFLMGGNCNSESNMVEMLPPSRNQEEGLEYTDLDKLPELSFYDDLASVGNKTQQHIHQPIKTSLSATVDETGVPLEVMVDLMREAIEKDRRELNLVHNPQCWSPSDVSRWVKWVCQKHDVPDISKQLESYSGAALCSWSSETFVSLYGTSGSNVFQELDLWKTANIYNTTAGDDVTSGLQVPFMESAQMFPSPATSPAPSHHSNMSSHSNHSHDVFNSFDNSEDEVFYPETDIKMEMNSPRKTHTTSNNNDNSNNNNIFHKFKGHPFKPRLGRGHKKAITLWQFLLELLIGEQDHSDCIKWVNKDSRIFKIEDSKKVASLWGKVKSRPAMNYDKLSRSVRQYYRKGIIKKPEQTKRLVYQFCPGIC